MCSLELDTRKYEIGINIINYPLKHYQQLHMLDELNHGL